MPEQPQRVAVFLDWQNVYNRARECFHNPGDLHTMGQVNPVDLSLTLAERGPESIDRELTAVRIYRGMPDNKFDPKAYSAARRQVESWRRDRRVMVETRPLRYPDGWVKGKSDPKLVKEKGIDVALAVDFVAMAADKLYDVGILVSCDKDLLPALERIEQRRKSRGVGPTIEVAAWKPASGSYQRLRFGKTNRPFCHLLSQQDYWGHQDIRDYTHPSPADHAPGRR